jgi:glycosyltransferase involved in cell wall biosynthesis
MGTPVPRHLNTTHRPLRVAMVVPPYYELPPSGYGGLEAICASLVDGLVARGHDVTLFGAGERTGTAARFVSTTPTLEYERLGELMPALLHAGRVERLLAERDFDIVHDHSLPGPLMAARRWPPTVVTSHGPVDSELGDFYRALGPAVRLVAISHAQRRLRPDLNWVATVHNGMNVGAEPPPPTPDGPVLWLGRFNPDKGPDLAIHACRAAGLPLVLAGKCNEPNEKAYLAEAVRPLLGEDVRLVVNGDRATTDALLAQSRCLLSPIRWHEPFGMVFIEAMAAGRPVVALRRGAVPEIVRNGITGWIRDHAAELPEALHRVGELDPARCVEHVRAGFSAELMAWRYEQVYHHQLAGLETPVTHRRAVPTR